ncbi:MAG TPA: LytTR family transcriptional regulator DNA-binding domain-containing protein [Chitinophagaceae bacterium]|jgi:DNA-binding LytR/AlgR family response regulator|nr:LytTR family transcriptional regulator DNA-binding domain-containing protein [Chitinophagaceae bacterium]
MTARILIAEDEFAIAMDIKIRLQKMEHEVVGIANHYEDIWTQLGEQKPDLVLMDINLGGSKSGIDAAKNIYSNFNTPVVFVTAFSDPATVEKAMETFPFGYVIKPFKDIDLSTAITVALQKHKAISEKQTAIDFLQQQPTTSSSQDHIFVKHKGQLEKLDTRDIIFLEALDNYTAIHTAGQKYLVNSFLKDLHGQLPEKLFIRTHKSYVVNAACIKSIEENNIHLNHNSTIIPISKSYRQAFFEKIKILH